MSRSTPPSPRVGWTSALARASMAVLVFETLTGLAVTLGPFHAAVQYGVLLHTLVGVVTLVPVCLYLARHWLDYKHYALSHVVLLGYVAAAALLACALSGLVITWQGLFLLRTSALWRQIHLITTLVLLGTVLPHVVLVAVHLRRKRNLPLLWKYLRGSTAGAAAGLAVVLILPFFYSGTEYVNAFPEDYHFLYGEDRPFAPSLATTETGGAYDPRSLAGSRTCGTSGCHEQILEEWLPSAHRYSAMDTLFQGVQTVMAKQNGPESTRYCGGCHDPISLFSGSKNLYSEELTHSLGYQEGVSCLVCHGIHRTDLQGNANYVIHQPAEYLWQWSTEGPARMARDFLIRTYPAQHNELSKSMYKAPEYCAACHKQFIDEEINQVGWVQLQNQYDNWAASHWNVEGRPDKTIECRECHMPLVDSSDPAAGDAADYNRRPDDGKHRSHRFLASNQFMPKLLELEGWEEQVALIERWLKGEYEIPEIADKWAEGPIVSVSLDVPETVRSGEEAPVQVVLTSNKVGHDFPTGPLDIIQSWVRVTVRDPSGNVVYRSGHVDEKHFIQPGSFMFKAEPVDQYGNLIDRHNLWEMVGVRYRRSLFPGYSDSVEYLVPCPASLARDEPSEGRMQIGESRNETLSVVGPDEPGLYTVEAELLYRKVDQYLINFLLGEDQGHTSPITVLSRATAQLRVLPSSRAGAGRPHAPPRERIGG